MVCLDFKEQFFLPISIAWYTSVVQFSYNSKNAFLEIVIVLYVDLCIILEYRLKNFDLEIKEKFLIARITWIDPNRIIIKREKGCIVAENWPCDLCALAVFG